MNAAKLEEFTRLNSFLLDAAPISLCAYNNISKIEYMKRKFSSITKKKRVLWLLKSRSRTIGGD